MTESQIAENFHRIREEIKAAELKSGRKEGSVRLCAVSKFHPVDAVKSALKANQFLFGENRVQEAYGKFNELNDSRAELHIIGQLQSNKVKKAVEIASCIQSVDRESLLEEIEKQAAKLEKNICIFFEYHTAEDSKSGYGDEDSLFVSLENFSMGLYPHIMPVGLMTMAPFSQDEKLVRQSFVKLRNLKETVNQKFSNLPITELSMGMSGDFSLAIEEGSTMVRVGTALFGERDYP
ncbi:YggS family pyridoxal phosphate-dependent enzyme [Treponema sp.]|uniref:YggS family pyridoxal phosphate-dependent enzyme n=1 Tax=Treponema sp. TaxID=166 RepID=UPI00298DD10D|nr:YggS family pyridoxal phosphate-dependent enzyme [Treponema sp.]MCI6441350.1 YggS family pyridoxal phosphate-dependent enzyme [Spirochaetia bacterium]MDY4133087.1 YggS family pyridoxal phosphate-dependent enzyme [Treponema sp.]